MLPFIIGALKSLAPMAIRTIGGALISSVTSRIAGVGGRVLSGPIVDDYADFEEDFLAGEEEEEEEEEEDFIQLPLPEVTPPPRPVVRLRPIVTPRPVVRPRPVVTPRPVVRPRLGRRLR